MNKFSLYLMITFYTITGLIHLVHPEVFIRIMPHWLPYPNQLVFISGVCEILFAAMLIFSNTRRIGLWGIMLLLIAVFPANIQMMLNYYEENNKYLWIAILRLPIQIILLLWAYGLLKTLDK
ncbi:MAG: DoxX family protein, partial [Bacteroidota bacterium]|nr:DoxX family protein [Bacteroidota bacterium]